MKFNGQKLFQAMFAMLALAGAVSGCGVTAAPSAIVIPQSSYRAITDSSASGTGDFSCPDRANVYPESDWETDGGGRYTVCASQTTRADIRVQAYGLTANASKSICVYPVEYVDERHIYIKPDFTRPGPLSQCGLLGASSAVLLTFKDVRYNAVFVVDETNRYQMSQCLVTGNFAACPLYSFGRFR